MASKRLIYKDEFGDTHTTDDRINGKFIGDKAVREKLFEYEQEESEGKLIHLPCKFLQKCFVIPTSENKLPDITEMECIGFALSNGSYNANLITDKNKLYQPCFGAFGKTVFLTREEAEKALKERENI